MDQASKPTSLSCRIADLCQEQIKQAGARYTPRYAPGAPNLPIPILSTAMDNMACGDTARGRFQWVLDQFTKAWEDAKFYSQRRAEIEKLANTAGQSLAPMMSRLRLKTVAQPR